ncbi:hypothetical protein C5167_003640 [Papaver somniferum]|uniref:Trichome birefringence-like N-terminal domain-containing protein n=1 Tax=Papaver somniferum TaxID=3469 RepID=A0A4Y7L1F6_PAPSO|nr:hypothetical protein C5167_003640 [Papaver somniferum]
MVDAQFNCQREGRPNSEYQRFQWKLNDCELPRFDGCLFLYKDERQNTHDYGVTLLFYKAPYVVDIDAGQGKRIL